MQSIRPTYDSTFERILLATDFSAASQGAFETSLYLCQISCAALDILNVFEYAGLYPAKDSEQFVAQILPLYYFGVIVLEDV